MKRRDGSGPLRFRTILEQTLLDPSLKNCFDALVRLNLAPSVYDAPQAPKLIVPITMLEKTVKVMGTSEGGVGSGVRVGVGDRITLRAEGLVTNWRGAGTQRDSRVPDGDSTRKADSSYIVEKLSYSISHLQNWPTG